MAVIGELLKPRPDTSRWVAVASAIVVSFLVLLGWHDGPAGIWPLLVLLCVCLAQVAYPTFLGWALTFVPFVLYAAAVAAMTVRNPRREYLIFLALSLLPSVGLYVFRPRSRTGREHWALAVAVALALLIVSPVFLTAPRE